MYETEASFEEFESAFNGDISNQSDTPSEETPDSENPEDDTRQDEQNDGNPDGEEPSEKSETEGEDGGERPDGKTENETFILKVNKEERAYSREEMIAFAQKGLDYDRVKEQLSQSRTSVQELEAKVNGNAQVMEQLESIAKDMDCDVPELLDTMKTAALKKQGLSDDAVKERILREKVERENVKLKSKAAENTDAKNAAQERMQREVAEFQSRYPGVELNDALIKELTPGVQGGMSLTEAYQKNENDKKDAQIAELQKQLAAKEQNDKNRSASPGSQKDSGGRNVKSDYDKFMEGFN